MNANKTENSKNEHSGLLSLLNFPVNQQTPAGSKPSFPSLNEFPKGESGLSVVLRRRFINAIFVN